MRHGHQISCPPAPSQDTHILICNNSGHVNSNYNSNNHKTSQNGIIYRGSFSSSSGNQIASWNRFAEFLHRMNCFAKLLYKHVFTNLLVGSICCTQHRSINERPDLNCKTKYIQERISSAIINKTVNWLRSEETSQKSIEHVCVCWVFKGPYLQEG